MVMQHNLDIMMLHKTKCSIETLKKFTNSIMENCDLLVNDTKGTLRGTTMVWNPTIISLLGSFSTFRTITSKFHLLDSENPSYINMFMHQLPHLRNFFPFESQKHCKHHWE